MCESDEDPWDTLESLSRVRRVGKKTFFPSKFMFFYEK